MKGYIYKITNPTGRIYIGQTISFKERIRRYKTLQCKGQKILYNSLLKYGWEQHKIEIIDVVPYLGMNNFLIDLFETYWIKEYKSNNCKYPEIDGMNLTDGGSGQRGRKSPKKGKTNIEMYGSEKAEELRIKNREAGLLKKHTPEAKEKCRLAQLKKVNFKHSDESKKKMSESHKRNKSKQEVTPSIKK